MKNGTYNLLRLWSLCCLGFLFAFSAHLKAVHVGSGSYSNTTGTDLRYSCDVSVRVSMSDGVLVIEYLNDSTWEGQGTVPGGWPTNQWAYLQTKLTRNSAVVTAVNHGISYGSTNRTYRLNYSDGYFVVYGSGKGGAQVLGDDYVFCTFQLVSGVIENLEYTEPPSIAPPWRNIVNGSEDNVLLICPYYTTPDGETHVRPIALLPGQSFELTPDFWKNQGVDVSELPEGTIFGYPIFEGSLDDWLNSKDNLSNTLKDLFAGNDYHGWDLLIGGHDDDTGKVWTGTEADCPSGLKDLRPINPNWWNKGKNEPSNDFKDNGDGTYVRNPEGNLATVDEVFGMYEDLLGRPLTNEEKDKILPGWNGSSGGNTGDGDGDDDGGSTGEKTDLSKVEGLLQQGVNELKEVSSALGKGIDVNVDIDMGGVEDRLDVIKKQDKDWYEGGFKDALKGIADDVEGGSEEKATGIANNAFGKADGWSNNFKNTFGGWIGLISVPALPELDSNVSFIVDIGKKKIEINPFKYNTFAIVGSWLRHFVLWIMYTLMIYGWMKHAVKMIALAFITPTLTTNGVSILGNEFTTAKGLIYAAILVGLLFGVINVIIGVMAGYAVVAIPNAFPAIIWNAMRMFDAAIPVIDLILYFPRYVVGYQSITMAVFGYKFIKSLLA